VRHEWAKGSTPSERIGDTRGAFSARVVVYPVPASMFVRDELSQ
jgi:hypothetical protein